MGCEQHPQRADATCSNCVPDYCQEYKDKIAWQAGRIQRLEIALTQIKHRATGKIKEIAQQALA